MTCRPHPSILFGSGSFACKRARTGSFVLKQLRVWFPINVYCMTRVLGLIPFKGLHPRRLRVGNELD